MIIIFYSTLLFKSVKFCTPDRQADLKKILRFHNLSFQLAVQCIDTFHTPTSITKQKMFGRYFHSLSVHAPILYRQVALRSLNAELQERLFNTCNDITKTTSNRQANTILNNINIRVQSESKLASNTLQKQEGEISALAASLPPFTNSKFPKQWIREHILQWQVHLERISDFSRLWAWSVVERSWQPH